MHVRNALARFNQVEGVTDGDEAFANIKEAAAFYGIVFTTANWRELTIARLARNESIGAFRIFAVFQSDGARYDQISSWLICLRQSN